MYAQIRVNHSNFGIFQYALNAALDRNNRALEKRLRKAMKTRTRS